MKCCCIVAVAAVVSGVVTALVTGPSLTHQLTVDRGVSQDYGKTFTIRKIVSQLRIW